MNQEIQTKAEMIVRISKVSMEVAVERATKIYEKEQVKKSKVRKPTAEEWAVAMTPKKEVAPVSVNEMERLQKQNVLACLGRI